MLMQHIGFRVRDFYKISSLTSKQEAIMGTNAQQKPDALTFVLEQSQVECHPGHVQGQPLHT